MPDSSDSSEVDTDSEDELDRKQRMNPRISKEKWSCQLPEDDFQRDPSKQSKVHRLEDLVLITSCIEELYLMNKDEYKRALRCDMEVRGELHLVHQQ